MDRIRSWLDANLKTEVGRWVVRDLAFACVFKACALLSSATCVRLLPPYKDLSKAARSEFDLYVLSSLHAFVCSVAACRSLRTFVLNQKLKKYHPEVYSRREVERVEGDCHFLAHFMEGYFLHDLIASFAQWRSRPDFVVHHLLALSLLGPGTFLCRHTLLGFLPHYSLLEVSTIFLNARWFARSFSASPFFPAEAQAALYQKNSILFGLSFAVLRLVYLPFITAHFSIIHKKEFDAVFPIKQILWAACGLQWYWAWRIFKQLSR